MAWERIGQVPLSLVRIPGSLARVLLLKPHKIFISVAMKAKLISSRKEDHIRICLDKDVEFAKSNGFERYEFEHRALPELSLPEIDLSTTFLDRTFDIPFFIEALTGGAPGTEKINRNLAKAAEELGIGMGLGSQRAMLEEP